MIDYCSSKTSEWVRMGTRKAFGRILTEVAVDYSNIIVLTADLAGSSGLNDFHNLFPERFFNVGIAEQNMTGIAAGLAKEGNNVFIVSFAPFVSMRNYEAIRTLIGYMHLNVKIVALGSGFSLGAQGNTHYCFEDLSLMRTIPGMMILSPADVIEEAKCIEYLADYKGPAYLRLTGIDGNPFVFKTDYLFNPDSPALIREGEEIAILSVGSIATECVRASRLLKKDGISCAVYDVCCMKPLNLKFVEKLIQKFKIIVTVEEHFRSGGLGSAICETACEKNDSVRVLRLGVENIFPHAGDYNFMLETNGLTAAYIREAVNKAYSVREKT